MAIVVGKEKSIELMKKIEKMKIVQGNRNYLKLVEMSIEEIKKLEPTDRLEYAFGLLLIISSLTGSLEGWAKWCNVKTMNDFTVDDFKKIFPKMRKIAIEWLKIDYDVTEAKTIELEKEVGDINEFMSEVQAPCQSSKSGKKKEPPSRVYVA